MNDLLDISRKGFRQKLGTYLVMVLLVGFTVAGYLVVSSYWSDAAAVSTAAAEPLDFPYLKARTLFAYWTNPPTSPDEEFPPPRIYAPVFNDAHLSEIASLPGVESLSVALEQTAFTRFGSTQLLSIEPGAQLWEALEIVSGRLPQNAGEVIVPEVWFTELPAEGEPAEREPAEGGPAEVDSTEGGSIKGVSIKARSTKAGSTTGDSSERYSTSAFGNTARLGESITVKVIENLMPRNYRVDGTLKFTADPEPEKQMVVVGAYKPRGFVSGVVGYLPVNRVDSYPEHNPRFVEMSWPVPNTVFLQLTDPKKAASVSASWFGMYMDYPGAEPPLIPPNKVEWFPSVAEDMIRYAAGQVATPLFSNTMQAFSLGAIGIFAAMLVSFLDRRKELGIMKTVGIDNNHTAGAVSLEVVFAGTLGAVLGVIMAQVATRFLTGVSGNPIVIPATSVLMGAVVSAVILLAATYIPRAMAKQGTVMELLYSRPIPIVRNRR